MPQIYREKSFSIFLPHICSILYVCIWPIHATNGYAMYLAKKIEMLFY